MHPNETFEHIFTSNEKAALCGEVFVNRTFVGIDLSGADLRRASFERTILMRCNLAGADLRGASFISSEFYGVVLGDALLGDNRFDGTTLVGVVGVNEETREVIERAGGTFQPVHASHR